MVLNLRLRDRELTRPYDNAPNFYLFSHEQNMTIIKALLMMMTRKILLATITNFFDKNLKSRSGMMAVAVVDGAVLNYYSKIESND